MKPCFSVVISYKNSTNGASADSLELYPGQVYNELLLAKNKTS